ncbi:recombinase family protein [Holzapfeliella sp. He02]|uniref:Recombinase family protein n=1 Tax=Holzapfeliella saturejae TaxID=3082953 RepID=A0ABU8SHV2_9LACO
MKFGYINKTSDYFSIDEQNNQLKRFGCKKIYTADSTTDNFDRLLNMVHEDDQVVITDLSVLGDKLNDIKNNLVLIREQGATFSVLNFDQFKTNNSADENSYLNDFLIDLFNHVLSFDHNKRVKKQKEGIQAAKEAGRYQGGRPKYTDDSPEVQLLLKHARENPKLSVRKLCQLSGIKSRTTVYSILKKHNIKRGPHFELNIEFNKKS